MSSHRLASLDALRGCTVATMLLVNDPGDWRTRLLAIGSRDREWLHAHRSGVPVFLFIVGVSVALALAPRLDHAAGRPYIASLAWAVAFFARWWLIVYAMDRRRCYLKL